MLSEKDGKDVHCIGDYYVYLRFCQVCLWDVDN